MGETQKSLFSSTQWPLPSCLFMLLGYEQDFGLLAFLFNVWLTTFLEEKIIIYQLITIFLEAIWQANILISNYLMICQSNNTVIRLDCVRDAITFFSTEGEYVISLNTSRAHSLTLNTCKELPKTGASLMPRFIQTSMGKLVPHLC